MTLEEEFGIRALDPILIAAAEMRRAKETMAASVDASERVRAARIFRILVLLEDGKARTRVEMMDSMPGVESMQASDRIDAVRNNKLIRRAGKKNEGGHNRILWQITERGRDRLATLRGAGHGMSCPESGGVRYPKSQHGPLIRAMLAAGETSAAVIAQAVGCTQANVFYHRKNMSKTKAGRK